MSLVVSMSSDELATRVAATVQALQQRFGAAPPVAVVLGSGWAGAQKQLVDVQEAALADFPAFVAPKVEGHTARLSVGLAGALRVAMVGGRTHTYESGDCAGMAGAIRSLHAWGVRLVVLTNAAGSLRPDMPSGSLMLIADHINAPQRSPLVGASGSGRFLDMGTAYDAELRAHAVQVAREAHINLHQGTYVWTLGPQFETPAEVRMFAAWGGDAVGMSTVPETILARHAGLRVAGLSLITNMAAGLSDEALSHAATLQQAALAGEHAAQFLTRFLASLAALPSLYIAHDCHTEYDPDT